MASNAVADPFIRRDTRPKILWNTGTTFVASKDAAVTDTTGESSRDAVKVPEKTVAAPVAAVKSVGTSLAEGVIGVIS